MRKRLTRYFLSPASSLSRGSPEKEEEGLHLNNLDGLTEEEKEAIRAFQKALKRRKEGKSDDDWGRDEEED